MVACIRSTLKYFLILYILLSYHTAWAQVGRPINLVFLAFGDSITYGTASSSNGPDTGYPMLLEKKLKSLFGGHIQSINSGAPGETTYGGVERFQQEVIANNPNLILLMEGTNDEYNGYPFDDTENNLRSIVGIALNCGKKIIIGTIPPVISTEYEDRSDQEARIEAFNPRIYAIANDYGIPVAQVFESITSVPDWEILLMDQSTGNHPNDAGYQVVRDAFYMPIVEMIDTGIFDIPPNVTTDLATNITTNTATLNGTVNPNGLSTTYYIEWGPTTFYGNNTSSQSAGSGGDNVAVSSNITGLKPNTTYHYRLVAANSAGTTNGSDVTFKTLINAMPWLPLLLGD